MKSEKKNSADASLLREKAEELLKNGFRAKSSPESPPGIIKLLHELEVHQVELEMQNEELRLAEEKATIIAQKFTSLYDFAPAGYFTLTHDGTILGLNRSGAILLGREPSSMLNSNFRLFLMPDSLADFNEFSRKIFSNRTRESCEVILGAPGKQPVYVQLEGIVSLNEQECLVAAIDISGHVLAEAALKESEARLRELNATKDKLFSIIAHDLKGPFNSIIGYSNILVDQIVQKDYASVEEYAGIIQKSSWRAMDLLQNLLEWSRLQTGRIEFNPEFIKVGELVDEVTELLDDSARQKSISIFTEFQPNTVVFADMAMISTIMRNLITNAIKFSNPGGEIVISAGQNQDEVTVSVADIGVGINEENMKKLFFVEENSSTPGTQKETGTGLGLLLCKEFVEKHEGKIWVESEVGRGSKFFFSVPNRLR